MGAHLLGNGLAPHFVFADYNQIREVCFDPRAALGSVDALIIIWRIEDIFETALEQIACGRDEVVRDIAVAVSELGQAVGQAARDVAHPVIVGAPPYPTPIGVDLADSVVAMRLASAHTAAREAFVAGIAGAPVQWVDVAAWQLSMGVDQSRDVVKEMVYKQPYTTEFWHLLGGHLGDRILHQTRPRPKCIVLDCDNTLWGGVVGEDGIGGIDLGSAFPGSAFVGFQRVLKSLRERGILLAVASKNNSREVADVFAKHDAMVLRDQDIAAWRVNWSPKSQNLREIAEELNVGLDALVMVDDSDYELAEIGNDAAEVRRLQVPEESALLPDLIPSSGLFRDLALSAEDLVRTDMIKQEGDRRQAAAAMTREEFLTSLELKLEYVRVTEKHVGRVAQLINKTNQFNLTTIRRSEADVRSLLANNEYLVRAMRVRDKFGDYGLVGVAILHSTDPEWEIDTLLMSCRVLSRGLETGFLATLAGDAAERGPTTFVGRYAPTAKNSLVADLYPRHGFRESAPNEFRATLLQIAPVPSHISVR